MPVGGRVGADADPEMLLQVVLDVVAERPVRQVDLDPLVDTAQRDVALAHPRGGAVRLAEGGGPGTRPPRPPLGTFDQHRGERARGVPRVEREGRVGGPQMPPHGDHALGRDRQHVDALGKEWRLGLDHVWGRGRSWPAIGWSVAETVSAELEVQAASARHAATASRYLRSTRRASSRDNSAGHRRPILAASCVSPSPLRSAHGEGPPSRTIRSSRHWLTRLALRSFPGLLPFSRMENWPASVFPGSKK